jgi:CHAD domain-containing protein
MAYRLDLTTDTPDALRAAMREQLDDAVRRLRDDRADDAAKAVHEARKDLKKARSLLRLARPGLSRGVYRRENTALRDIGRSLSGARDADVLVQTVAELGEHYPGQLAETQFQALGAGLAAEAARARATEGDDAAEAAVVALDAVAARVGDWPLGRCDHETLVEGATREYERGCAALADVEKAPTLEQLHELRKRVKDLWYHGRLLEEAWPRVVKAQSKAAHDLSDLLGDDHDMAVLAERVEGGVDTSAGTAVDVGAVVELSARRRGELQAEALPIARRLYAEPPEAFRARLLEYVRAAAAERRVPTPA